VVKKNNLSSGQEYNEGPGPGPAPSYHPPEVGGGRDRIQSQGPGQVPRPTRISRTLWPRLPEISRSCFASGCSGAK
jgi:hypothetical protein